MAAGGDDAVETAAEVVGQRDATGGRAIELRRELGRAGRDHYVGHRRRREEVALDPVHGQQLLRKHPWEYWESSCGGDCLV